jgi:hypothetical protein
VSETVARSGSPYVVNLTRLGYAVEEISAAFDEVVDAITAWGNPERIAAGIRKHLDAGADHVRLATIARPPGRSTSTSHGGGYRRSASATSACPTPWSRADDRTASHVICVCGAARSSIPPRIWPLGSRTHSAVLRLMFRRNVDSKSGIGPNRGSTTRTISSQDTTSPRVLSLTALTRTECPLEEPSG